MSNKLPKEFAPVKSFPGDSKYWAHEDWQLDSISLPPNFWNVVEDEMLERIDSKSSNEDSVPEFCAIELVQEVLNEQQAFVVEGYLWRGKSYAQLGKELGVTKQRVHIVYHKSLEKLKEYFEEHPELME